MEHQDKRHIPQSSGLPRNLHTRPADNQDTDKLRENPHNDEKIITQQERSEESNADLRSGSAFAKKDEDGMNRVTNEQEQNKVVNPVADTLGKKDNGDDDDDTEADPDLPSAPEIPAEPDNPAETPYEPIGDDPGEMSRKLPRM